MRRRVHQEGEKNRNAKLTEAQVKDIRQWDREGLTGPALAWLYGLNIYTVHRIIRYKAWTHVKERP